MFLNNKAVRDDNYLFFTWWNLSSLNVSASCRSSILFLPLFPQHLVIDVFPAKSSFLQYSLTFLPADSRSFSGQSFYHYNFAALFRFHPFFLHDQSNIIVCLLWSCPYFCPGMNLTVSFLALSLGITPIVRPTRITFLRVVSNSSSFYGICWMSDQKVN